MQVAQAAVAQPGEQPQQEQAPEEQPQAPQRHLPGYAAGGDPGFGGPPGASGPLGYGGPEKGFEHGRKGDMDGFGAKGSALFGERCHSLSEIVLQRMPAANLGRC